jgi:hypothetical protein
MRAPVGRAGAWAAGLRVEIFGTTRSSRAQLSRRRVVSTENVPKRQWTTRNHIKLFPCRGTTRMQDCVLSRVVMQRLWRRVGEQHKRGMDHGVSCSIFGGGENISSLSFSHEN